MTVLSLPKQGWVVSTEIVWQENISYLPFTENVTQLLSRLHLRPAAVRLSRAGPRCRHLMMSPSRFHCAAKAADPCSSPTQQLRSGWMSHRASFHLSWLWRRHFGVWAVGKDVPAPHAHSAVTLIIFFSFQWWSLGRGVTYPQWYNSVTRCSDENPVHMDDQAANLTEWVDAQKTPKGTWLSSAHFSPYLPGFLGLGPGSHSGSQLFTFLFQ